MPNRKHTKSVKISFPTKSQKKRFTAKTHKTNLQPKLSFVPKYKNCKHESFYQNKFFPPKLQNRIFTETREMRFSHRKTQTSFSAKVTNKFSTKRKKTAKRGFPQNLVFGQNCKNYKTTFPEKVSVLVKIEKKKRFTKIIMIFLSKPQNSFFHRNEKNQGSIKTRKKFLTKKSFHQNYKILISVKTQSSVLSLILSFLK